MLTGWEEVAANGSVAFLGTHHAQLGDAFVLCPDNCGAGQAIYAVVEGMCFAHPAGPALVRGYQALSMLGLDERGVPPIWHWPTDTFENVDEDTVNTVTEFLRLMIEKIDDLPAPGWLSCFK